MPDPCRLDVEVQSDGPLIAGFVTAVNVIGHASRNCTRVHVTVRTSQLGTTLFSGDATTQYQAIQPGTSASDQANDGLWQIQFSVALNGLHCGDELWVEAQCIDGGGTCQTQGTQGIQCKQTPGTWPWPDPPQIACPRWGRIFLELLFIALVLIAAGVSAASVATIAAGLVALAAAAGMRAFWEGWCVPPRCVFWGGVVWVYKWATLAALLLAIGYRSFAGWLVMIAYGIVTGWIALYLQRRHCRVPSARTPLSQLPLW